MKFPERVLELAKQIPKGRVTTYKIVAEKLNTRAYRAIGQVLKSNKNPKIPCHRVVKSSGELGGYRGNETHTKAKILRKEGIEIRKGRIELEKYIWKA